MNNKILQILDELYQIDSSLRNKEEELIKVIAKMIDGKPETHFNENFKNELKEKIIQQLRKDEKPKNTILSDIIKNLSLILSWAIIASFFILTIFPQILNNKPDWDIAYNNPKTKTNLFNKETITNSDSQIESVEKQLDWINKNENSNSWVVKTSTSIKWIINNSWIAVWNISNNKKNVELAFVDIKKVGDRAFWDIQISSNNSYWWAWWASPVSSMDRANPKAVSSDITSTQDDAIISNDSKMELMPETDTSLLQNNTAVNYVYSYTWKLDWIESSEMQLYKKIKPTNNNFLISYLNNIKLDWFDFSGIKNWNISNFEIKENKEYWLDYQINLDESKVFISKNFEKWPQTQSTYNIKTNNSQIKISDFPKDETIINLSKEVIKKYKIDTKNYWEPIINNSWKIEYNKIQDKSNYILPDAIQVIYPLIINNREVFEDYWDMKWLKISFDVKTLNLAEISWIEWISLLWSDYQIENNIDKINSLISKWWRNAYNQYHDPESKIKNVAIHLSKPKLSYINIPVYNNWTTTEYYVPAYIFESIEKPKDWEYFQQRVVVPLIKEFFDSANQIMR